MQPLPAYTSTHDFVQLILKAKAQPKATRDCLPVWNALQPKIDRFFRFKQYRNNRQFWNLEDYRQEAWVCMVDAIEKYDPAKGPFIKWFMRRLLKAMQLYVAKDRQVALPADEYSSMCQVQAEEKTIGNRRYTEDESYRKTVDFWAGAEMLSVDYKQDEDDLSVGDEIEDHSNPILDQVTDLKTTIVGFLSRPGDHHQAIIFYSALLGGAPIEVAMKSAGVNRKWIGEQFNCLRCMLADYRPKPPSVRRYPTKHEQRTQKAKPHPKRSKASRPGKN